MERAELAARLVTADQTQREPLLKQYRSLADVELAYALTDICLDEWSNSPVRAAGVAAALKVLADLTLDPETIALSYWMAGFSAVVAEGQIEQAITLLEDSEALLLQLGKPHTAASTQVIKLYALALLGRYDEAIGCGLRAREVLLAHGDIRAAGKIEHNIGNIYLRRDRYQESEQFQLAARERFAALNDRKQLAKIDNNLAIIYTSEHKFRRAEQLYDQALRSAEAGGLVLTQAEIEASIGNLALFQGRYDRALDYLERSRRKYAALGMPHQSAVAWQEMADAYLEMNLAPEAAAIYPDITRIFAELGMQAEQARALSQHARASVLLGRTAQAHTLLSEARRLYAAEGNPVGEAVVMLTEAQLHYAEANYQEAARAALMAEEPLAAAGTWRRQLLARWIRGESARAEGHEREASRLLQSALSHAQRQSQPDIAWRCLTSLALIAIHSGGVADAEALLKRAIMVIEDLRTPLPTEEFRTAFLADKLLPYNELVRLCLEDKSLDRASEALCYLEGARSRALLDILGGALNRRFQPRDSFEAGLLVRLEELREELNWFYNRINLPAEKDSTIGTAEMATLHGAVRQREGEMAEIIRQLPQHKQGNRINALALDIAKLQRHLSETTALVEFTSLDGRLQAFIVTDEGVEIVRDLCGEKEVDVLLEQFRFQFESLRYGAPQIRRHMAELTARIQHYLRSLYDLLLRSVEERIGERRLIIVPHRSLHYLPFHALHDGSSYLIERREIGYAPSAVVLLHCLNQPRRPLQRGLLVGVSDEQTPKVRDEIGALVPLFPESVVLLDEQATLSALREFAPGADVLHMACHGKFRPDNPLFSSLQLGDGWLTVRDTYNLELNCGLAALSACETGVNKVAPGDELIGLARGLFSAGAPSLLISLWTVDDTATAELMASFYKRLLAGAAPSTALRGAQLELLKKEPHPFFWSPFIIIGRW